MTPQPPKPPPSPPPKAPAKAAANKPPPMAAAKKPAAQALSKIKAAQKKGRMFIADPVTVDSVGNEDAEIGHYFRLQKMVYAQTIFVAILAGFFVLCSPIMKPIYHYYARDPAGNEMALDPLLIPNMTNHAVLSWAVTSVTEIMTFGFGDIIPQLSAQRPRFTERGWDSFVTAFHKQNINETFKENQLVLTTVPSNTAVILSQGKNPEGVYQWKVQVPVIMTYATNNNVTRPNHAIVTLTIVRVPPNENDAGIAIKNWSDR